MKNLFFAAALGLALTFSVTSSAQQAPSDQPMPVLFQTVKDGPTFPVLAQKDGQYFPVFIKAGEQPYFADAQGKSHYVGNEFPIFYMSGQTSAPVAVPQGQSDAVKDTLLSGNSDAKDTLVNFRGRGWYGYGYTSYNRYCYYPSYSYGYYGGRSYYGGGYYGGYYSGYRNYGYYGGYYNSGYYGWRSNYYTNPYYYSGYGYVLNNYCW